jgi:DNA polymerase (family 10)
LQVQTEVSDDRLKATDLFGFEAILVSTQETTYRPLRVADLKADLHTHTTWSDGELSIEQLARQSRRLGRRVIAITDHSCLMGVRDGTFRQRLKKQREEIHAVQERLGDSIYLLHGAEVDILEDGRLEYPDDILAELDIVVASLHTELHQSPEMMTERLVRAMHNPYVDIIAHPSGRILPMFEGAELDWEQVFKTARRTGVALEIDANPDHLDLDEEHARLAAEYGVLFSVDSDTHRAHHLRCLRLGVRIARHAGLRPDEVINTWSLERLLRWLRSRGA